LNELVGLYPTTPQSAAGTRVESPVSEPIAISHMPSAGYVYTWRRLCRLSYPAD
jgi:hypothetical protein